MTTIRYDEQHIKDIVGRFEIVLLGLDLDALDESCRSITAGDLRVVALEIARLARDIQHLARGEHLPEGGTTVARMEASDPVVIVTDDGSPSSRPLQMRIGDVDVTYVVRAVRLICGSGDNGIHLNADLLSTGPVTFSGPEDLA